MYKEIKAKIKRQIHLEKNSIASLGDFGQSSLINALENLLSFIESLEKEKPNKINVTGDDFSWMDELKHDLEHPEELDKKVTESLKNRGKYSKSNTNSLYPGLDEAAEKYESYYDVGDEQCYLYTHKGDIAEAFQAGAKWMAKQGETKEGVVCDKGEFIKFSDGTYIDLDPTQGLIPAFKVEDGDHVIAQIRKKE